MLSESDHLAVAYNMSFSTLNTPTSLTKKKLKEILDKTLFESLLLISLRNFRIS